MTETMTVTVGLYGKMPGRGDFLRHGWDDATVEALDLWLADGLAAWRPADDTDFAALFAAAPLYEFYLPAGRIGPMAMFGVISPSVDRAGRYFFLVAGVTGAAATLWHLAVNHAEFAYATADAVYAALGAESDPDLLVAAIAAALPDDLDGVPWRARLATPADAVFWAEGDGDPLVIRSPHLDAKLLAALLDTTPITGGVA